jgi:hypothetical protein
MAGTATNDVLSLLLGAALLFLMGVAWRWLNRILGGKASGSTILTFGMRFVPFYFGLAALLAVLGLVRLLVEVASRNM